MIRMLIELWPHGDHKRTKILGTVEIANDDTGDVYTGNYDVTFSSPGIFSDKVRVENFNRTNSVYKLLHMALEKYLYPRKAR